MKFDIKDKKKNPLMKRDELIVSIDHAGKATPNRLLVLSEIAKLVKNKPENIIINRIITPGGSTASEVKIFSYSKKDDIPEWRLKKMEQRASKVKGKPKEEPTLTSASKPEDKPKPEGEAAQEPAQEKPEQEESKESDQAGETSGNEEAKPADGEQHSEPAKEEPTGGEKPEEASHEDKNPPEEKKEETSGEAPADDAEKPSTEDRQGDAEEGKKKEGS